MLVLSLTFALLAGSGDCEELLDAIPGYHAQAKQWVLDCTLHDIGGVDVAVVLRSSTKDPDQRGGYLDQETSVMLATFQDTGKGPVHTGSIEVAAPSSFGQPVVEADVLNEAPGVMRLAFRRESDGEGTQVSTSLWHVKGKRLVQIASVSHIPSSGSGYPQTHEQLALQVVPSLAGGGREFALTTTGEYCHVSGEEEPVCESRRVVHRYCFVAPGSWAAREHCWLAKASASSALGPSQRSRLPKARRARAPQAQRRRPAPTARSKRP